MNELPALYTPGFVNENVLRDYKPGHLANQSEATIGELDPTS